MTPQGFGTYLPMLRRKMEAANASTARVLIYGTTQCHIPENGNLNIQHENHKSHYLFIHTEYIRTVSKYSQTKFSTMNLNLKSEGNNFHSSFSAKLNGTLSHKTVKSIINSTLICYEWKYVLKHILHETLKMQLPPEETDIKNTDFITLTLHILWTWHFLFW
jgi:hypothetical protein